MKMLITKKFVFEMAHALPGYDGKCANLHGHSYHLEVTVEGSPLNDSTSAKQGMVLDFSQVKEIVNQTIIQKFDHALVLPQNASWSLHKEEYDNLIVVDFQPTTENLLLHFASLISPRLPHGVSLHRLMLAETESSYAELIP